MCWLAATRCCTRRSWHCQTGERSDADDLARVENVGGIEGPLDRGHHLDSWTRFLGQAVHLAEADAVLPGAGAAHFDRAPDQALVDLLRSRKLLGQIRVDQHQDMEIAVADMADDRRQHP